MFDRLIHFSIHNKLIIGILTLALVAWGGYSLSRLPIDAVPDITTNQIVVYTVAPSLAASDIERLVSFPVEQSLATIPNREEVRSFSRFGLSVVTIVFEDGVDIYWARQQVAERLREAESQIPESIGRPEMAPVSTGLGEVYQYLVRAKPGDRIRFLPTDPSHNAEAIPTMLPPGVAPPPAGGMNKEWVLTVTKPGLYGVKCKPHYSMGMVGLVQVGAGPSPNLVQARAVKLPPFAAKRMNAMLAQAK